MKEGNEEEKLAPPTTKQAEGARVGKRNEGSRRKSSTAEVDDERDGNLGEAVASFGMNITAN